MKNLTGEIIEWGIFSLKKDDGSILKDCNDELVQVLIGNVAVDYQGRFEPDYWFRSSRIVEFNDKDRMAKTLNSTYKLLGNGYRLCGTLKFFELFVSAGIEAAMALLPGECEVYERFVSIES